MRRRAGNHFFRQFQHVAVGVLVIGVNPRYRVLDAFFLVDVNQVFAVSDNHPAVMSARLVQLHRVAVKFVFAAVHVQHRPGHAAQQGTRRRRFLYGEGCNGFLVSPEVEGARLHGVGFKPLQGRRAAACRKRRNGDVRQLVTYVLGAHGHNARKRGAFAVHAEGLRFAAVVRRGKNNAAVFQFVEQHARDRVFHRQFKRAVSVFLNGAGQRVGQRPQAVAFKVGFVFRVQSRLHRVHHLGSISTRSIPPSHETPTLPSSVGNSATETALFLFAVSRRAVSFSQSSVI